MAKFKNKHRIASARAGWWDYGWNGPYFITICTRNREHYFCRDRACPVSSEYQRISDYIITNPDNWINDKFYVR